MLQYYWNFELDFALAVCPKQNKYFGQVYSLHTRLYCLVQNLFEQHLSFGIMSRFWFTEYLAHYAYWGFANSADAAWS